MLDPLAQIIKLLKPRTVFSKGISGAGSWAVRYSDFGHPSFCVVLSGSCRLAVDGESPVTIEQGDFVLLPATPGFTMSSFGIATPTVVDPKVAPQAKGEVRHGSRKGPADVRLLGGYFVFGSPDAGLIVSLLPTVIHLRAQERLSTLVRLVVDETRASRSGRDLVLERLMEILLIEALREAPAENAPVGLLKALGDAHLAPAIRLMHERIDRSITVVNLAKSAGLSRSVFFERFVRTVGIPPMEYLLSWRMAVARDLLRREGLSIGEVAQRVGYASSSTFSTAFSRSVGQAPGRYAKTG